MDYEIKLPEWRNEVHTYDVNLLKTWEALLIVPLPPETGVGTVGRGIPRIEACHSGRVPQPLTAGIAATTHARFPEHVVDMPRVDSYHKPLYCYDPRAEGVG